jgi:LL-diaminopimelate aminotransferase
VSGIFSLYKELLMNYIRDLLAKRIGGPSFGTEGDVYTFERIKRAKREASEKNKHIKLIDVGVGEPDEPADSSIVTVLSAGAGKPENRFYADNGIDELKVAASGYLEKVYNVRGIDPGTGIIHGIGSK